MVDYYFTVLENVGETIENVEDTLVQTPNQELLNSIYGLKRELVFMRKAVWPMREVVSVIQHSDHPIFQKETSIYFRDIYDHTIQIVETLETFRDPTSWVTFLTIPALVLIRSSRLMPGFRGIPAVMITISEPAVSS